MEEEEDGSSRSGDNVLLNNYNGNVYKKTRVAYFWHSGKTLTLFG